MSSFLQDFNLLLKSQIRVSLNTLRQRRKRTFIGMFVIGMIFLSLLASLGSLAYGALEEMPPQTAQGFLALLFMVGMGSQIFFGITAAFAALYMSDDLELLFMTPVSLKAVFAVKSLSVLGSNLVIAVLFAFLPGIFYGLLFQAGGFYYFLVFLVGCGLWLMGAALAELINLLVMRIVPPHRSKEAMGFIGALAGIIIVLVVQIPNLLLNSQGNMDIGSWLTGKEEMLEILNFFPWGWASLALVNGISGTILAGLGWSVLIVLVSVVLFLLSMILLERGFRQGFISLSQGEGGRTRKKRTLHTSEINIYNSTLENTLPKYSFIFEEKVTPQASSWLGMWAVAKKDLLSLKRDTREWFGYLMPLTIMAFFVAQFLFTSSDAGFSSLIIVLIMYTIMFSGNMALQAFGREGESDWLLSSVPLIGWPVVWGKLVAAVLPTLILMEALLVGTSIAVGFSASLIVLLAFAAVLLSLGSSSIGLYYSIHNARYNPDKPQMRISPSASLVMYLTNLLFLLLLGLSLSYLFPPMELISLIESIPPLKYEGGFLATIVYVLYLLSRPLLWPEVFRILLGIVLTGGVWTLIFFGFMTATVRQSRKGFRVEHVSNTKSKKFSRKGSLG
ncbi:MAG: hypothetical protein APF84_08885 [Gracilibacter sp. BRH_c7a]|nr:MAG: hypothetical protein APF84_08885 [Gracilibacter sp. BRH_c7a]